MDEQPKSKTDIYADALIEALTTAATAAGGPDINAALSALTFTQAYLIAKAKDRNTRRQLIATVAESLPRAVSEQVTANIGARLAAAGAQKGGA